MPFTLSHPSAAIPFSKCGFVLSALIIGSMAPDFGNFLPPLPRIFEGRSMIGLWLFDLPAGLLVLWFFHRLLKEPLLALLPANHRDRLVVYARRFNFGPPRRFILILVSILIGAITHIIWDYFTHETGWFVVHFPFLRINLFWIGTEPIQVFKLLQYVSSLVGAGVLIVWYRQWYYSVEPEPNHAIIDLFSKNKGYFLVVLISLSFFLGVLDAYWTVPIRFSYYYLSKFLRQVVVASMAVFFIELFFISLYYFFSTVQMKKSDQS